MHKHLVRLVCFAATAVVVALVIVYGTSLLKLDGDVGTNTAIVAAVLTALIITILYKQPTM
ncbi:MAG: hypothetical protein ABIG30_01690 [Candidatus Aenigmatarchaeota archaeon]